MRFQILGPLRTEVAGRQVTIAAERERALLAMLLLQANSIVPTGRLIEGVWADEPPHNGRNQLQKCVSRLRRRLADAGADREVIVTEPAGYRIDLDPADLDLGEFRRLAASARTAAAAGDHREARARYRSALARWRGPALAGIDVAPVRRAATALDEQHLQVLLECLDSELAAGGAGELVTELAELVRQHPYREGLRRALMLALYRSGRQADALAAYREARRLLHDDVGTEPGAELQRLHHAILNRDPALDAAPPPAPAAALTAPVPRELPADVAAFTGRVDALKALDGLRDGAGSGPVVISAIAGTAGVGKTALAVHWAHQVAEHYPDGQLYLNLRGYAAGPPLTPTEALATMLRSLGTPPEQIPVEEAEASARLRSLLADRRALLLLDNARSADQVRPLLPGTAGCLVLVTSRDSLAGLVARDGARRVSLDVLPAQEAHSLLTRLLGDRGLAEPEATSQLAAACAYLPLALRIAAALLDERPHRRVQDLVRELGGGHRLAALQLENDQEAAVRATLDLSYHTIPAPAQRLFRLLGLAPGPDLTAPAAAAVAELPLDQTTHLLGRLAGAHLLDEQAPGRYSFHDLLREYAAERAKAEDSPVDRAAAVGRLLDHYLRFADTAADLLYPQVLRLPAATGATGADLASPAEALAWLETEHLNLVAAVRQAAQDGPRQTACLLADRLRRYFWLRRHTLDWLATAGAALVAAEREGDLPARAAAHLSFADLHYGGGRYEEAIENYQTASRLAELAGWADGHAAALGNTGLAYTELGRLELARESYRQALAVRGGQMVRERLAVHGGNLGTVEQELGRLEEAATRHQQALAGFRELGSVAGEATALTNLGNVAQERGRLAEAATHLTRALDLHREAGDRSGESCAHEGLAMVRLAAGRPAEALEQARRSLALASVIEDDRYEAEALSTMGAAHLQLGDPDRALDSQQRALSVARRAGLRRIETRALLGSALVWCHLGRYEQASTLARQALGYARTAGYRVLEGQALTTLAQLRLRQDRPREADEYAEQALANHRATGHRLGEAGTLLLLGQVERARALLKESGAALPRDVPAGS